MLVSTIRLIGMNEEGIVFIKYKWKFIDFEGKMINFY